MDEFRMDTAMDSGVCFTNGVIWYVEAGEGRKHSVIEVLKVSINVQTSCIPGRQMLGTFLLTNCMAYGTRRFNGAFTRALQ